MTHLVVVDGSNLFMRNYHGLKAQDLRTESGHPTWGTYGYFKSLSSLSQLLSPTHLVVAWDFGKSAKRHLLDPNYKMNRTSTREDDLALQLDDTQRLEVLLGIKSYGEPGVEADDIIADVVFQWEHQVDGVIIVSGDHDMEQLISDRVVVMKPPSKSGGAPSLRDLEWVQETYPGVPPPRLPEIWALQGDSSDDIPGVPRVGPKTALKLIQTYGNLGGVLVSQESKLDGYRDRVRLNHQLIQLTPGVSRFQKPLGWAEWPPVPPDTDKLKLTLEALEFLSLWEMYLTNTLWHKEKIGTRLNDVVHEDQ